MGQILTFYSYKGGVGRTMALANVAILLARWKYRVLLVDWDLEAPGIENYYFKDDAAMQAVRSKPGVVDLLAQQAKNDEEVRITWRDCLTSIELPDTPALHFITAGKRDETYFKKVRTFDLDMFYSEHEGGEFIERLRDEWREAYDFVLLDSRTGITDVGGICTIQLPDKLITVLTATDQGLAGALDVARRANEERLRLDYERFRMHVIPVPSRFETLTENSISLEWLDKFAERLGELYSTWLPAELAARRFLEVMKIPYVPFFSFGESLPIIERGTTDPTGMGYAYESLAALLANNLQGAHLLLENRDYYIQSGYNIPRAVLEWHYDLLMMTFAARFSLPEVKAAAVTALSAPSLRERLIAEMRRTFIDLRIALPRHNIDGFLRDERVQASFVQYLIGGSPNDVRVVCELATNYTEVATQSEDTITILTRRLLDLRDQAIVQTPIFSSLFAAATDQDLVTALANIDADPSMTLPIEFRSIPLAMLQQRLDDGPEPETAPNLRLFLSYSSGDSAAVSQLRSALRRDHYDVWTQGEDGHSGGFDIQIEQALRQSDAVLVLVSSSSNQSRWVRNETLFALDMRKTLIPVLIERGVRMPLALYSHQYVDCSQDWDKGYQQLKRRLELLTTTQKQEQHLVQEVETLAPEQTNPFVVGAPVPDELFVGRQRELSRIVSRIEDGQSLAIIGARRIGKTSLLSALTRMGQQRRGSSPSKTRTKSRWCVVYIDMQFPGLDDGVNAMRTIRRAINRETGIDLWSEKDDGDTLIFVESLEDFRRRTKKQYDRLVLIFDEWEAVYRSGSLPAWAKALRRVVMSERSVNLVVAATTSLFELSVGDVSPESPFFNIFQTIYLGLMPADEWSQIIENGFRLVDMPLTSKDIEMIGVVAGGHPFLTQAAGYALLEAKYAGVPSVDADFLATRVIQQAEFYFRDLWTRLSEEEKEVVRQMLNGTALESDRMVSSLASEGVISLDTNQFIGSAFEHWLRRSI